MLESKSRGVNEGLLLVSSVYHIHAEKERNLRWTVTVREAISKRVKR